MDKNRPTMTINPKTKSLEVASGHEIKDTLSVHPETVKKVAKKSAKKATSKSTRKPRKRSQPKKNEPPVTISYKKCPDFLNKKAWTRAMFLAGGDYKRLVVESPISVLVKNQ